MQAEEAEDRGLSGPGGKSGLTASEHLLTNEVGDARVGLGKQRVFPFTKTCVPQIGSRAN